MIYNVLYSHEHYSVISKPAGHVVHSTRGAEPYPKLVQGLRDQLGLKVYPVHRLDRPTSGCIVFAHSSEATAHLQAQLVVAQKKYWALCRTGRLSNEGVIDRPLKSESGKLQEASTLYKCVKRFSKELQLLELDLKTGRKNQIRRHLSFEGCHIVGDINYGKGWLNRRYRESHNFWRMFLHCFQLSFQCPWDCKRVIVKDPLPTELAEFISKLVSFEIDSIKIQ